MLALGRIESELKQFEATYSAAIWQYGQREIDMLKKKIAYGLDIKDLVADDSAGIFGFRDRLRRALVNVVGQVREFGRQQVRDEIARQAGS